jgi:hypothetical protein
MTVDKSDDGAIEFVKVVHKTLESEYSYEVFEFGKAPNGVGLFGVNTGDRFEAWQVADILSTGAR